MQDKKYELTQLIKKEVNLENINGSSTVEKIDELIVHIQQLIDKLENSINKDREHE